MRAVPKLGETGSAMTKDQAGVALAAYDAIEPWIAAWPWQAVAGGWSVPGREAGRG